MKSMDWSSVSSTSFEKSIIHYARYGRILKVSRPIMLAQILLGLFMSVTIILSSEFLSNLITTISSGFLEESAVASKKIVWLFKMYYLEYKGRFPSIYESAIYALTSLAIMVFVNKLNLLSDIIRIYSSFFLLILLSSSLFFSLFPYKFPYSSSDFSVLYITIQVGIFSFIPMVLGMALAPLCLSLDIFIMNLIVIIFTMFYSLLFGVLRYSVALYVLDKLSYIWMANLFFNLGPFLDMIYISGIYSFYLSIISSRYGREVYYWKWIY